MRGIVFDCEIFRAIPEIGQERDPDLEYCFGWGDFFGMEISCVTAIDTVHMEPRVFLPDNFGDFAELLKTRDWSISFNGTAFDIPLLSAAGLQIDPERHCDLALAIWRSAGVPEGTHPKGLGLNALCRAAGISGKRGEGCDAPRLAQTGQIGKLVDYCLGDTFATAALLGRVLLQGGVKDPRPASEWNRAHGWIPVGVTL